MGNMLTAEAGRMAQSIGLNRAICGNENKEVCYRTFWTIYILEKTLSFRCDRDSVSFIFRYKYTQINLEL